MTQIQRDDIQKLASLSALTVTGDESDALAAQLTTILEYVEQLNSVDTEGVEPTYQVTGLENVMREDVVIDYGLDRDALLANAPEQQDGQIRVRRVL